MRRKTDELESRTSIQGLPFFSSSSALCLWDVGLVEHLACSWSRRGGTTKDGNMVEVSSFDSESWGEDGDKSETERGKEGV